MLFHAGKDAFGDRRDAGKALTRTSLCKSEDLLFGVVENVGGFLLFFESLARDRIARTNELAEDGLVVNDLYVLLDVRKMRQSESKIRNRGHAADRLERTFFFEFFADENRVDLPLPFK